MTLVIPQPQPAQCGAALSGTSAAPAMPPVYASAWQPSSRYADQPMSLGTRQFGIGGVSVIGLLILCAALFTWRTYSAPPASTTLNVFDVRAPASPPEIQPEEKDALRPVERTEKSTERPKVQLVERTIVPIPPVSVPLPRVTPTPTHPAPTEPETAAPETMPAPLAPQVASHGADSWEGRVLAALNKHRQYPRAAMARGQQEAPWIRFVMDREGKVLSSRLERSSSFPDLDREAVALAKRASPLPKPPDDKPGETLELVVPVEFSLTR